MVAGGISRYEKTELIVVDKGKTVNEEYYRDRILPFYTTTDAGCSSGPHSKCYHDEDPVWLSNVWSVWPGDSHDLNSIEHLWAKLQDSVIRKPCPRNRDKLIKRVKKKWVSVTQDIYNLIESFPKSVENKE